MNFLKKLFGITTSHEEIIEENKEVIPPQSNSIELDEVDLRGDGEFALEVVGESFYQDNFKTICGPRTSRGVNLEVEAKLILENDNPKDKKAVRIDVNNLPVGYLKREIAIIYRRLIKQSGHSDAVGVCRALIKGGWENKDGSKKGNYGIWLDIPVEED